VCDYHSWHFQFDMEHQPEIYFRRSPESSEFNKS
jgi:hypothetical protein